METIETQKTYLEITDIRQSQKWFEYLKIYGWEHLKTSTGINIALLSTAFGKFAKIQRSPSISQSDLAEIELLMKKHKALFLKIEPSLLQDISLLDQAGFKKSKGVMSPPSTLFIDLTHKENDIWNGFSHSAKYSIKRAVREGARVERIVNPSEDKLIAFYTLVTQTKKKKRFTTTSQEHLLKQAKIFGEEGILFLVYGKNNELFGGKYFLGFNKNVWFMYGGTSSEGRKNKSGYNLVWESLLGLKRFGYRWLDFEGVADARFSQTTTWEGFAHFKEKFGGEKVEFALPRIKYYSSAIRLLNKFTNIDI